MLHSNKLEPGAGATAVIGGSSTGHAKRRRQRSESGHERARDGAVHIIPEPEYLLWYMGMISFRFAYRVG